MPSPFAATSHQKTTIKNIKFMAHLCTHFSAFHDCVVVVPVCLRVAVRKQEGREGRKGGREEGMKGEEERSDYCVRRYVT